MTPPRFITEGMVFYVTVRAVNRSFRFVPKRKIRESIDFALAVILEKYRDLGKIQLHEFEFMSNHYHLLGTDLRKCLPAFIGELNSLISRQLNALRGISGENIAKGFNLVRVQRGPRVVEHAIYTLANPVRASLAARSRDWKATSSLKLRYGQGVTITRPKTGLWAGKVAHADRAASQRSKRAEFGRRWVTPDAAVITIDRPPVLLHLSDDELRDHILEQLAAKEDEYEATRSGDVLGFSQAIQRDFLQIPGRTEELFGCVPNESGSNRSERAELAAERETFVAAYYRAMKKFVQGLRGVVFPEGTWLMRHRYGVRCEPLPILVT